MSESASAPFLRHPQRTRRRRRHPLVRWAGRCVRLAAAIALPVAFGWWGLEAEELRLTEIRASGGPRVDGAWVEDRLAEWRGDHLLFVSLRRVEESVLQHPWAASVTARKELPGRLVVEVRERRAAAVLDGDEGGVLVDAEGVRIGRDDGLAEPPPLHLRLAIADPRAEAGAPDEPALLRRALGVAETVSEIEPLWGLGLDTIEILGDNDFRLRHRDLDYPVLAAADTLRETLPAYRGLEAELHRRYPGLDSVDLRIRGRIVVRPRPPETAGTERGS